MHRLRSGLTSFRRIHLAALIADWRRTLLSVIGVALGVTVVLGVLVLKSELSRPFDSFGPSLTHAADIGVVEVSPNVSGRLPIETVDRLRSEVAGAQAVIPIVAGLTPVDVAGGSHGFFLLGGSCQIELLVGAFDCEQRARDVKPADGPGVPFEMPAAIAERHGVALGDELLIPGLPPGSAHLGWTFPEFDRVEGINDGYVLIAPSADVAATLLSTPGYVTAAFILPRRGADVTADADRVIAGIATVGPPRPHVPAVFANSTQSLNLTALAGIIVGILIAVNTVLLAVEDRRAVMGTIGAIGAKPVGLFGGMLGEGAVVGVIGGLLGVPSGFLLGQYLVDRFGRSMLAGSGGSIAAHFSSDLIVIGAAAGVVCGILAMFGPAARLIRDGPLASMASIGGVQRARTIPMWPLVVGTVLLAASVVLLKVFERGSLPLSMGINGLTVALCGVVLVTVWIAPRAAAAVQRSADERSARRRAAAWCRHQAIHAAVRIVRRATGGEHQPGHRLEHHATAGHRTDCRAEGRPNARRLVDQRAIGARPARRPDFRPRVRFGDRRRRRAQRVVALAVDDLVGDVVAAGRRRHAGRLVQRSDV